MGLFILVKICKDTHVWVINSVFKRKLLTIINHFIIVKANIYGIIISWSQLKKLTKDFCPKLPKIMHFGYLKFFYQSHSLFQCLNSAFLQIQKKLFERLLINQFCFFHSFIRKFNMILFYECNKKEYIFLHINSSKRRGSRTDWRKFEL